jgi:hypothetical protein
MQGNYVKLAHPPASDLRKRAIRGLISGSLSPEHHIDFHTMSGVLEDRAAFDPLPVVVGRVLVQDCPQMQAGRRTARIERRQVLGGLISKYRKAA